MALWTINQHPGVGDHRQNDKPRRTATSKVWSMCSLWGVCLDPKCLRHIPSTWYCSSIRNMGPQYNQLLRPLQYFGGPEPYAWMLWRLAKWAVASKPSKVLVSFAVGLGLVQGMNGVGGRWFGVGLRIRTWWMRLTKCVTFVRLWGLVKSLCGDTKWTCEVNWACRSSVYTRTPCPDFAPAHPPLLSTAITAVAGAVDFAAACGRSGGPKTTALCLASLARKRCGRQWPLP